jgi:hypothetical protein
VTRNLFGRTPTVDHTRLLQHLLRFSSRELGLLSFPRVGTLFATIFTSEDSHFEAKCLICKAPRPIAPCEAIADLNRSVDILVIGAGPTGLGAAKRLNQIVSATPVRAKTLLTKARTAPHG